MRPLLLGRVRRALVVAPHPDDEVIGAWGLIRLLARRGVTVQVLVTTDGAGSHRNSLAWPRVRLVRERRLETRRALARIGVAAGRIAFLDLPDGTVPPLAAGGTAIVRRTAARGERATLLVGPSRNDDHPDHRAVAEALARVPLPGTRRLSYLVWPNGGGRRGDEAGLTIGAAGASAKRAAVRRYRTQTGAIGDDPAGFAIGPAQLRRFAGPIERFREERR